MLNMKMLANRFQLNTMPRLRCNSNYKERFAALDKQDNIDVIQKYKDDLNKFYSQVLPQYDKEVLETFDESMIQELHFMQVLDHKPISKERKIRIRKFFLPYLEVDNKQQRDFLEDLLVYYECI